MSNEEITYLNPALVSAARRGQENIAIGLIKLGADVHWHNEEALREAAKYGQVKMAHSLRCHGADIEKALWFAASWDDKTTVKNLLNLAANTRFGAMLLAATAEAPIRPVPPGNSGAQSPPTPK